MSDTTRTVTLTNSQWVTLCCCILDTTWYREHEYKKWSALASQAKEDGTPMYPNAAGNARYYKELEEKLTDIRHQIEA
jgi:hypothetical protein